MMTLSISIIYPLSLLLLTTLSHANNQLIFTLVNNCPFTVWPAIQPNGGHQVLERGGFALNSNTHRSFAAPSSHWAGRIWARTHCTYSNDHFTCATGGCGNKIECDGAGTLPPVTLAQFTLHHGNADYSSYSVSLVDGYNVPLTITPHEGKGQCPVIGCKADLIPTCPSQLQLRSSSGHVVGCKSGCAAFNSDELCCRGQYNSPQKCRASTYSDFFKHSCPETITHGHDSPSLMHQCSAPRELKVIFCH